MSLSSVSVTIDTVPPLPLTFYLFLCMYIHDGRFIPLVPSQNRVPDDFEINYFRRVVNQGYVCPSLYTQFFLDRPRSALCTRSYLAHHSQIPKLFLTGATRRSCPPICPPFRSVTFAPRLNVNHRVRVTRNRDLSQTVGIAVQMVFAPAVT